MAVLTPCRRCPMRDGCAMRDELRERLRGLAVRPTSVKVSCQIFKALFPPGSRVAAKIGGGYEFTVKATVLALRPTSKLLLQVDEDSAEETGIQNDEDDGRTPPRYFIRVYADKLIRLPEPDRKICDCGNACDEQGACIQAPGKSCWVRPSNNQPSITLEELKEVF